MKSEDKIKAIQAWQNNVLIHPFTCANNSNHRPLIAEKDAEEKVILKCPDCSYRQAHIPEVVLTAYTQKGFHQNDTCNVLECKRHLTRDTCQTWITNGMVVPICNECAKKLQKGSSQEFSMGCKQGMED